MPKVLFTSANASAMARKSWETRRQAEAELTELNAPNPAIANQEAYTQDRLMRVRKQLDRLDRMILTEDDPQKLDRLISATSRLEEQERKLSGRFAPGTTKPTTKPTQSRPRTIEPQAVVVVPVEQKSGNAST